jgi:hypothetical protein
MIYNARISDTVTAALPLYARFDGRSLMSCSWTMRGVIDRAYIGTKFAERGYVKRQPLRREESVQERAALPPQMHPVVVRTARRYGDSRTREF